MSASGRLIIVPTIRDEAFAFIEQLWLAQLAAGTGAP